MARCYSRDSKRIDRLKNKMSSLDSPEADSGSDMDYIPDMVIRNDKEASSSQKTEDIDEEKKVIESSDLDSDSDVSYKPPEETVNNNIKISCFSEDKLPSSFINEVVSNSSDTILIRSSIQNLSECDKWVSEFGKLTSTKWNSRTSRPFATNFNCSKKYVCHRSAFHKVPVEKNKRSFSKNSSCLASLQIKVKISTYRTKRNDPFIKRGLLAVITINDGHNHSINTSEDLKYFPKAVCREKFIKYFDDGMGIAESIRYHKMILELDDEENSNGHLNDWLMNPSRRSVQHWYNVWRDRNRRQSTVNSESESAASVKNEDDIDESAASSKNEDDIDEGASTSKASDGDGESVSQSRIVLSLRCLHEDTDDESSFLKIDENDLSAKFIDVNDVPELPLNDKKLQFLAIEEHLLGLDIYDTIAHYSTV